MRAGTQSGQGVYAASNAVPCSRSAAKLGVSNRHLPARLILRRVLVTDKSKISGDMRDSFVEVRS